MSSLISARSTIRLRCITLTIAAVFSLATLTGCAPPLAKPIDTPATPTATTSAVTNSACSLLLEKYIKALDSSSIGLEHPGNYTVKAASVADLAALLPPGALDGTGFDCVVSAYSSAAESTQITGVILYPSTDAVSSIRDALSSAGWEADTIETGVAFRGPKPDMDGAQTFELDATTAERVGVPPGAFAIVAGKWNLWGAF